MGGRNRRPTQHTHTTHSQRALSAPSATRRTQNARSARAALSLRVLCCVRARSAAAGALRHPQHGRSTCDASAGQASRHVTGDRTGERARRGQGRGARLAAAIRACWPCRARCASWVGKRGFWRRCPPPLSAPGEASRAAGMCGSSQRGRRRARRRSACTAWLAGRAEARWAGRSRGTGRVSKRCRSWPSRADLGAPSTCEGRVGVCAAGAARGASQAKLARHGSVRGGIARAGIAGRRAHRLASGCGRPMAVASRSRRS